MEIIKRDIQWKCTKCGTDNKWSFEVNPHVSPIRPRIVGNTTCMKCGIDRFSKTFIEFQILNQLKEEAMNLSREI